VAEAVLAVDARGAEAALEAGLRQPSMAGTLNSSTSIPAERRIRARRSGAVPARSARRSLGLVLYQRTSELDTQGMERSHSASQAPHTSTRPTFPRRER
jgi:hypothetical protein